MSLSVSPLPSLKKRRQFLALRQAPRFSCRDFVLQGNLQVTRSGASTSPAIGYTVTRKIGNSVERNRIRRRLREAVAAAYAGRKFQPGSGNRDSGGHDDTSPHAMLQGEMVVVARRGALDAPFQNLVGNFTKGIDHLVAKGNKAHVTNDKAEKPLQPKPDGRNG